MGLLVDHSRQLINCRKRHLSQPCPVSRVLIRQIHKRETPGPWIWKDVVGVSKRQSLVSLSSRSLCRSSRALLLLRPARLLHAIVLGGCSAVHLFLGCVFLCLHYCNWREKNGRPIFSLFPCLYHCLSDVTSFFFPRPFGCSSSNLREKTLCRPDVVDSYYIWLLQSVCEYIISNGHRSISSFLYTRKKNRSEHILVALLFVMCLFVSWSSVFLLLLQECRVAMGFWTGF